MPRVPPHFKVRTSLMNHPKMVEVARDNDLLALYVRLGTMAIERFADRTGDSFVLHKSELLWATGRERASTARVLLHRLCAASPIDAVERAGAYIIHIPNLAEKQGFSKRNGGRSCTPLPLPLPLPLKVQEGPPSDPAAPRGSARKKRKEKKPPSPEHLRLAEIWADLRFQTMETPRPTNPRTWADSVRLIVERDGYSLEALEAVIRWLYSPTGNLGGANGFRFECHSPVQARKNEKLPAIVAAMKRQENPVGRDSNYVPPPKAFEKPEGTPLSELTDEQLEKIRKDTAAVRAKLPGGTLEDAP